MKVYDLDFPITYFGKLDSWPNLFQQKKEQPGGGIVGGYFAVVKEWVLCTRIGIGMEGTKLILNLVLVLVKPSWENWS